MPFYVSVSDLNTGGNQQTANGTVPKGSGDREGFETSVDDYSASGGLAVSCIFTNGIFFDDLNYADWQITGILPTQNEQCVVEKMQPDNTYLRYDSTSIADHYSETRYICPAGRLLDDTTYIFDISIPKECLDANNGHVLVQVNFRM